MAATKPIAKHKLSMPQIIYQQTAQNPNVSTLPSLPPATYKYNKKRPLPPHTPH